jgi:hypothetical protein
MIGQYLKSKEMTRIGPHHYVMGGGRKGKDNIKKYIDSDVTNSIKRLGTKMNFFWKRRHEEFGEVKMLD